MIKTNYKVRENLLFLFLNQLPFDSLTLADGEADNPTGRMHGGKQTSLKYVTMAYESFILCQYLLLICQ